MHVQPHRWIFVKQPSSLLEKCLNTNDGNSLISNWNSNDDLWEPPSRIHFVIQLTDQNVTKEYHYGPLYHKALLQVPLVSS